MKVSQHILSKMKNRDRQELYTSGNIISSFVYIAACEGLYKIGVTKRLVKDRLQNMQVGNSKKIIEISSYELPTIEQGRLLENSVKFVCAEYNVRGEWFDINLSYIKDILLKIKTIITINNNDEYDYIEYWKLVNKIKLGV